jgi:hypothetical protein
MVAETAINARDTAPTGTVVAMTASATYNAGRAVLIDCTATGTFIPVFADGTSATIHLQANTVYEFNWSIISWAGGQTGNVYNEY